MSNIAHLPDADYTIRVEVSPRATQSEAPTNEPRVLAEMLEQLFVKLAPLVVHMGETQTKERFEQLVGLILGDHGPLPIDMARASMKASALRAIFEGTEWLTAAQIVQLAGLGSANPSGTVNRWKQRGKVFAVAHHGQDHYPRYLLDDSFRPLPAAEQVLEALPGFSPDRLASWFESRNGLLGGKRPRELLGTEPQSVIEAARRTIDAEQHAA